MLKTLTLFFIIIVKSSKMVDCVCWDWRNYNHTPNFFHIIKYSHALGSINQKEHWKRSLFQGVKKELVVILGEATILMTWEKTTNRSLCLLSKILSKLFHKHFFFLRKCALSITNKNGGSLGKNQSWKGVYTNFMNTTCSQFHTNKKHKLVAKRFKETEPSVQSSLSLFTSWFDTSQYSLLQLHCFLNYHLNAGWLSPLTHWFLSLASNWFFMVSSSALETYSHHLPPNHSWRFSKNEWSWVLSWGDEGMGDAKDSVLFPVWGHLRLRRSAVTRNSLLEAT